MAALVVMAACSGAVPSPSDEDTPATNALQINGAGATFPYPIYSKWFAEYNKHRPNIQINYQSIGSGGGIRQLSNQTVFFGASDAPMDDRALKNVAGSVLHFPTVLGAVVPIYNVPGASGELRFTGSILADIYLGTVKKWNDPAVAALNPGIALPNLDIVVVHRSDGSGTTFIFLDYLAKVSASFARKVGVKTSVRWPVGVGGKGNEGVSGLVTHTPGAIGYVELIYAVQNKIPFAAVQNAVGEYVKASPQSVTAAAASSPIPDDFRVSITDAAGAGVYPISSFTWLLLYENPVDKARANAMVDFLTWALTAGQKMAPELGYASLPDSVVQREMMALAKVKVS